MLQQCLSICNFCKKSHFSHPNHYLCGSKNNVPMSQSVQIKNALISVYYKDNLEPIIQELHRLGVTIYSTGGTETFIRSLGADVIAVEDLTSYPSILGGRVKTLHPKVFGGILARRNFDS